MPIQFQCAACSEPIEIDDEWAGKLVACPYCRKTITAPPESTFFAPSRVPTAKPVAGRSTFEPVSDAAAAPPYEVRPPSGNAAAVWALGLACGSVICLLLVMLIFGAHLDELQPFVDMKESGKPMSEINRAFLEHFQGSVPGWLALSMVVALLAIGLWLAGVICGLIAVRRPSRRKLAIASLLLSALTAFFVMPRS